MTEKFVFNKQFDHLFSLTVLVSDKQAVHANLRRSLIDLGAKIAQAFSLKRSRPGAPPHPLAPLHDEPRVQP